MKNINNGPWPEYPQKPKQREELIQTFNNLQINVYGIIIIIQILVSQPTYKYA